MIVYYQGSANPGIRKKHDSHRIPRIRESNGFAWIRSFANPCESKTGFAKVRIHANPRIRMDSTNPGFSATRDSQNGNFANPWIRKTKKIEGFANPIFWDSQDLAFMRIPGFALMRIHANPHFCQNLILRIRIRMNANPDANPNASHKVRGSKII